MNSPPGAIPKPFIAAIEKFANEGGMIIRAVVGRT